MTDRDVVAAIGRLVPGVRSQFRGDECHALFLTKSDCLLGGLARRLSPADKREVLRLVSLLPHLRLLDLRRNRLGPVPDLGLERLEWLDLGSNYMGAVPDWLRRLPLQYLSLGVNELKFIPDWLGGLPLTTLKLHKNEIANVDAVRPLRALKFLNLYFNRIKPFPEFVFEFPNVRFFSWGVSGLERLPDGVGRWAELRWLSLVANRLTELPDAVCGLRHLTGLRLNKNRLERLPEDIGNLATLRHLFLYKNRLRALPASFGRLRLDKLNLARNEFADPPDVTAGWCVRTEADCTWS